MQYLLFLADPTPGVTSSSAVSNNELSGLTATPNTVEWVKGLVLESELDVPATGLPLISYVYWVFVPVHLIVLLVLRTMRPTVSTLNGRGLTITPRS